jgi:hypothetical protein
MNEQTLVAQAEEIIRELPARPLVRVVFSVNRDAYCVPAADKAVWLSTKVHPKRPEGPKFPIEQLTADGMHVRRAYSKLWQGIKPGRIVTLPADDVLVKDYLALPPTAETE